jgi:hypothetical protein
MIHSCWFKLPENMYARSMTIEAISAQIGLREDHTLRINQ